MSRKFGRPAGGIGRGHLAGLRAQCDALAAEIPFQAFDVAKNYVLDVRDNAEANSRAQLGFAARPDPWNQPRIQDSWWAASAPRDSSPPSMSENSEPCDHARAALELELAKPGDTLWVWSNNFRTFFHEYGYYDKSGGARPKWMLRNAIVAASSALEVGEAA